VASLSTARRIDRLKATETDHVHPCDQRSTAAALAASGITAAGLDSASNLPGAWLRATEPLPEWINF
jgi:hypothetical protein